MQFYDYPTKPWDEVLRGVPSQGRDLIERLVRYESQERMPAAEVKHSFLACFVRGVEAN